MKTAAILGLIDLATALVARKKDKEVKAEKVKEVIQNKEISVKRTAATVAAVPAVMLGAAIANALVIFAKDKAYISLELAEQLQSVISYVPLVF
jgi:phage terminase Nu1 subunit (DNA packaging protein)